MVQHTFGWRRLRLAVGESKRVRLMSKLFASLVFVGLVSAGCTSAEVAVRLDDPDAQQATNATSTSTTTATTTSTTSIDLSSTSTTSKTSEPLAPNELELTWAAVGTIEADVERAFWPANFAHRHVYGQSPLDPEWPPLVESTTGRELERVQTEIREWIEDGFTMSFPEESETVIEFLALVRDDEAIVDVCELDRGVIYENGEVWDDVDVDSNFQARFVLVGGQWLWEETIKVKFDELPEGGVPTCMGGSET